MEKLLSHRLARLRNLDRISKESGLESLNEVVLFKNSNRVAFSERAQFLSEELKRLSEWLAPRSKDIAETAKRIAIQGAELLAAFHQANDSYFENRPEAIPLLEAIVRIDGSRPSFLIRNGEVDLNSCIAGQWETKLKISGDFLKKAISAVGRVNNGSTHIGSGFLLDRKLLLTNRHVLQSIGLFAGNKWQLYSGANVDFGFEFQCFESRNKIKLKSVVFSGDQLIAACGTPDHGKLDMALIELEGPAPTEHGCLEPGTDPDWGRIGNCIYTIGYPADPGPDLSQIYGQDLLQKLFHSTYSYKRLAPGRIIESIPNIFGRVCHDATTLGGSSGSLITVDSEEYLAAGIHYAGRFQMPAENWSQSLAVLFAETSESKAKPFSYFLNYKQHDLLLQIKNKYGNFS